MVVLKFIILAAVAITLLCPGALAGGKEINLLFGGDVTFGGAYPSIVPGHARNFSWPFGKLEKIISETDVFMVNCENAITDSSKKVIKKFNFKMNPKLVEIFRLHRIQVTLANNHVFDYGTAGLFDTIKYLDESGVDHVGAGKNLDEARKPIIKTVMGKKIFFLAYGNYSPAGKNSPGVAYRDSSIVIEDIQKAKRNGADIIVVNFHWGIERQPEPEKVERKLAHMAIDNGADVIIGHHPHVTQPVEMYKGKIIAYSLGNFIFGGNSHWPKESFLLKVIIDSGKLRYEKIKIRIDPQETKYQPYVISDNSKRSR